MTLNITLLAPLGIAQLCGGVAVQRQPTKTVEVFTSEQEQE